MKDKTDEGGLLLAGVGVGLLGLGYAAYKQHERSNQFRNNLSAELQDRGLELISVDLGRMQSGEPLWHITVRHPAIGVQAMTALFQAGSDPFSDGTRHNLVSRVAGWFERHCA